MEKRITIFESPRGPIQIEIDTSHKTIWITQKHISDLFEVERSVVTKHLKNIFKSGELNMNSNVQFLHIANSDKPVKYYNLDCVISVGYRINTLQTDM